MIDRVGFDLFQRALAADPLARAPARPPRLGAPAWLEALAVREPFAFFDRDFRLRPNASDGNCLFHALAGAHLSRDGLRAVRRAVAAVRMGMRPAPGPNARRVIAALLQTPETRAHGIALADRGLAAASNGTYAALQCVTGMQAGEAEIRQWCAVHDRRVLVVDSSGRLARIGASGARAARGGEDESKRQIERALKRGRIVLFKTPGHWRRIDGLAAAR